MENLITIIVATYNNINGLFQTLESVRLQNYENKELIISDDGSKTNIMEFIGNYIENYGNYFKYINVIQNKVNIGTVKNLQNAYMQARGSIIKAISPGDLLYSSSTLKEINDFFELNHPLIACGIPRTYKVENKKVVDLDLYNTDLYTNKISTMRKLKRMLFGSRYITGATLILTSELLNKDFARLPDSVIYCEDLLQVITTIHEIPIMTLDKYIIWYEFGNGISTNKGTRNKLFSDHVEFYKWISLISLSNLQVMKWIKVLFAYMTCKNKVKKIQILLSCPTFLFERIIVFFYSKIERNFIKRKRLECIAQQGNGFLELI